MPFEILQPSDEVKATFLRGMQSLSLSPEREGLPEGSEYAHLPAIPLYTLTRPELSGELVLNRERKRWLYYVRDEIGSIMVEIDEDTPDTFAQASYGNRSKEYEQALEVVEYFVSQSDETFLIELFRAPSMFVKFIALTNERTALFVPYVMGIRGATGDVIGSGELLSRVAQISQSFDCRPRRR